MKNLTLYRQQGAIESFKSSLALYFIIVIWFFIRNLDGKLIEAVSVQFSSVAQSCLTLCDPMNCSTPGLPVHHQLPKFSQTHVHGVGDTIQPSHPLLPLFLLDIFPIMRLFSNEPALASVGQSTGASSSVLLMNVHS